MDSFNETSADNSSFYYDSVEDEYFTGECYYSQWMHKVSLFEFILTAIILNIVVVFGIIGNVLSMIILCKKQMRSSINCILLALAVCDTILITCSSLLYGLPEFFFYNGSLFNYVFLIHPKMFQILYPISVMAHSASIYLTIVVSLERFVAVTYPLKARSLCTYSRAKIYVAIVLVCSIIYNFPRFWEVNIEESVHYIYNITVYCIKASPLRLNQNYIVVYHHWMFLILKLILPLVILGIFNFLIYKQVKKANVERQSLSSSQKEEISLAVMLMCVVIVFFICNIFILVKNIMEVFFTVHVPLVKVSNLLVTINSSVNFIIYMLLGKKFRKLFLKMFCSLKFLGRGLEYSINESRNVLSNKSSSTLSSTLV